MVLPEKREHIHRQISASQARVASKPADMGIVAIAMYCVLLLSYLVNAGIRQLFPLLAHDVRREFGFSLADTGLLSTIFTLGLAITGLLTGYLLSRFSRKAVLVLGIAIFSTATALTGVARGFTDMFIYLAATGIGEGMQLTVMIAIAANYFVHYRAAAIGSMNVFFGIGAVTGPILGGIILSSYRSWRAPMLFFALLGNLMIVAIVLAVRPWFSEARGASGGRSDLLGASTLLNRNTFILCLMSVIGGLVFFGFSGMYPTYLREALHYSAKPAGIIMSFYGVGALGSIAGGLLGDRFPPRYVLSTAFFFLAGIGYLLFHNPGTFIPEIILTCAYGTVGSGTIYVNLAASHVKAVQPHLSSRASGMFVTSLYASAAVAGYAMGVLVSHFGWARAGEMQITLPSVIAGCLALTLRPAKRGL